MAKSEIFFADITNVSRVIDAMLANPQSIAVVDPKRLSIAVEPADKQLVMDLCYMQMPGVSGFSYDAPTHTLGVKLDPNKELNATQALATFMEVIKTGNRTTITSDLVNLEDMRAKGLGPDGVRLPVTGHRNPVKHPTKHQHRQLD